MSHQASLRLPKVCKNKKKIVMLELIRKKIVQCLSGINERLIGFHAKIRINSKQILLYNSLSLCIAKDSLCGVRRLKMQQFG